MINNPRGKKTDLKNEPNGDVELAVLFRPWFRHDSCVGVQVKTRKAPYQSGASRTEGSFHRGLFQTEADKEVTIKPNIM